MSDRKLPHDHHTGAADYLESLTDETEAEGEPAAAEPESSGKHSLRGWLRRLFS